jgi:soluble lytic murein transglycosylase-like protein
LGIATALVLLTALQGLMALNGAIRALRGAPSLLSVSRLPDKLAALSTFAIHLPRHPACPCGEDLAPKVRQMAALHRVPPGFALAIARAESRLRSHVVSRTGAMGTMQLMPSTARWLGVIDAFDPRLNIEAGVRYLATLLRRYRGSYRRAAAAYNLGPGRVPRRGKLRLPRETQRYVKTVMRRFWSLRSDPNPG